MFKNKPKFKIIEHTKKLNKSIKVKTLGLILNWTECLINKIKSTLYFYNVDNEENKREAIKKGKEDLGYIVKVSVKITFNDYIY